MGAYYSNLEPYPMDTSCNDENILTLMGTLIGSWLLSEIFTRVFGFKEQIFRTESLRAKDEKIIKDYFKQKLNLKNTIRGLNLKNIRSRDELDKAIKTQKKKIKIKKKMIPQSNEISPQPPLPSNLRSPNSEMIQQPSNSKMESTNIQLTKIPETTQQKQENINTKINLKNYDNRESKSRNLYRDGSQWNDKSLHSLKREMLEKIIILQQNELNKRNPDYNTLNKMKYKGGDTTPTDSRTITNIAGYNESNPNITPFISPLQKSYNAGKVDVKKLKLNSYGSDENNYFSDDNANENDTLKNDNNKNNDDNNNNNNNNNEFMDAKKRISDGISIKVHFSENAINHERTTKKPMIKKINFGNKTPTNTYTNTNTQTNTQITQQTSIMNSPMSSSIDTPIWKKPQPGLHQMMSRRFDNENRYRLKTSPTLYYLLGIFTLIILFMSYRTMFIAPHWWYDHFILMKPETAYYRPLQHAAAVVTGYYTWEAIYISKQATFQTVSYIHHWFSVGAAIIMLMGGYMPNASWYATWGIGMCFPIPFGLAMRLHIGKKYPKFVRKYCNFAKYWYLIVTIINIVGQTFIIINGQILNVMPPWSATINTLSIIGWLYADKALIDSLTKFSRLNYEDLKI